jgi:hypothetical protein
MDADRSGLDGQPAAGWREQRSVFAEGLDAFDDLPPVLEDRIRLRSGHERTILAVGAVGEDFSPDLSAEGVGNLDHSSAGEGVNFQVRPMQSHGFHVAATQADGIFDGMVETPVEFNVVKRSAKSLNDALQRSNLLEQKQLEFVSVNRSSGTSEVFAAGKADVSTDPYSRRGGEANAVGHGGGCAGMATTGNVGRGDPPHQRSGFC